MTMIPDTTQERLILLAEIERGDKVVIPTSMDHARFMLMIAQSYITQHEQAMIDILTNGK